MTLDDGSDDRRLFHALGFEWDRSLVPRATKTMPVPVAVYRYQHSMAGIVWDASQLEGNPFTFPEIQTLMDGITVGGRKVSDANQVQGLVDSARELVRLVESGEFELSKGTSDHLHLFLARHEALDAGRFRGEGSVVTDVTVHLGERGIYRPPATEEGGANLRSFYDDGLAAIESLDNPVERAFAYKAFACRGQLYYDGNKRLARHMMNGELMSHGIDAISVPAARRQEYNEIMVDMYAYGDATRLFRLLWSCSPSTDEA